MNTTSGFFSCAGADRARNIVAAINAHVWHPDA
jgi:hypothetical protein